MSATDAGVTPRTFIVGAGPVAISLAGALRRGGVPVLELWARREAAARRAGAVAGVLAVSGSLPVSLRDADAIIIAVRDEAIGAVANALVATGYINERAVLLHCSGARPARDAFAGLPSAIEVATLHPLRALADGARGIASLPGTVFGIEGGVRGLRVARSLALAVGGVPLVLASERMVEYHAAAAIASNYLVALLDAAATVLAGAGMSTDEALQALLPLARGSLQNVAARGTKRGLTGPIRRGDSATVQRHLDGLRARPGLFELYRALGLRTLALARELGDVPAAKLAAIARLLEAGPWGAGPSNR